MDESFEDELKDLLAKYCNSGIKVSEVIGIMAVVSHELIVAQTAVHAQESE